MGFDQDLALDMEKADKEEAALSVVRNNGVVAREPLKPVRLSYIYTLLRCLPLI